MAHLCVPMSGAARSHGISTSAAAQRLVAHLESREAMGEKCLSAM